MAVVTITDTTVTGTGTAPDAPTALTTETEWDAVRLHWTNPSQRDVDYIQIWRSTTNDRATATMVAQVKANDYTDHSLETGTRYYWIRAISTTGLTSAYHPSSATAGVSGIPDQVAVTSPQDKHLLQYDSATSTWTNGHLRDNTLIQGALQGSTNASYTFPLSTLSTVTSNTGIEAVSGMPASTLGYGSQGSFIHYFGDTFAGSNTSAVFAFRTANGNSTTSGTVPFTGLAPVAASAVVSGNTTGGLNFNGYATTGFSDYISTQNQGGGINAIHALQAQAVAQETFSDSTLTLTSANITAVSGSTFRATLNTVSVVGTRGQIQYAGTLGAVGHAIQVTGTLIGTATGITAGNYWIVAYTNDGTNSTATLSATPGGAPITTTAGTLNGLTLRRCGVIFTLTGQTTVPFGRGAKVAVTNVTNVTDGTYPVFGTPTTTSISLGIPYTTTPTLPGTQTFSCTASYLGSSWRVRGFPLATPANVQNRVNFIDHSAASATYRADTFVIAGGAYGDTSAARLTVDSTKITAALPVVFPSYTKAQAATITGAVGWQIAISDSAGGGNPNGMMAFWDTTNARWSYIHDNSAV